jgi:hypothetical protein
VNPSSPGALSGGKVLMMAHTSSLVKQESSAAMSMVGTPRCQ